MRKTKKAAILTIFMAAVLTVGSIPAFAKDISFSIYKTNGEITVDTNTKDLSGSTWYISNQNKGGSNFIEDKDVIDFRVMNSSASSAYSGYHSFSKFVDRYPLLYTTTPSMGTSLTLRALVDNNGQYNYIHYVGEWVA